LNISDSFSEIIKYSHFWKWAPDWGVVQEIYESFPNSYSVLSPFAYSYLEELIRSQTSDYAPSRDENGNLKKHKVSLQLINLAISENQPRSDEYIQILEEIKVYFSSSTFYDVGDNRHSVAHGYMHPRFWDKESFAKLIYDIARLSKFSGF
tara:strand:- start:201 stop:653 length:453 start_codon:yes stop_codon:yes gene_type:complete